MKQDVYRGPSAPDQKMEAARIEDEDDFLVTARKRFNRALVSESENRKNAIDDLNFKNGNQWPQDVRTARTLDKRPCLTVNKMKTFVHQVTNNMKNNRPSINISPIGDKSDKNTATMLKGLIRQIERNSGADIAYDIGFDSAVSNGWGYWRILTDYEDDDSFDQVIKIEPIRNPLRVYLDPDHQMPDGSDAKWGFISDLIPREEFEALYPDAEPVPFDQGGLGDDSFKDWSTQTHVRIAEYFCYKTEKRRLIATIDGATMFYDELSEEAKKLIDSSGDIIQNEREVEVQKVMWSKMTSHQVLEDNDWPGRHIPIIKCSGDVVDVEGKPTYAGLIRDAKDPQRMKNYWATHKTELVALAPKAPFILEEGQIEGHEGRWQQANIKSYPYLLYKGTSIGGKQAPMPQRQQLIGAPAGIIEAEQSAEQDMMGTTGVRFDATKSERIPDESGKALKELKFLGELGSFHYTSNYVYALKYTATQLIDLIPKIYDAPRVVTILREDDTEETVKIDPSLGVPYQTKPGAMNKVEKLYNPGLGKYMVAVTIGPNFQTQRSEAAEGMLGFLKAIPNSAPIIADLIAKNMDWPYSDEIAERLAATIPPHILGKGMEDLDPKARAIVGSLNMQLQQMQQLLQQVAGELESKKVDQAIQKDKNDKDYDAKIADVAAKLTMHIDDLLMQRLGGVEDGMRNEKEAGRDQMNKDADREAQERQSQRQAQTKAKD